MLARFVAGVFGGADPLIVERTEKAIAELRMAAVGESKNVHRMPLGALIEKGVGMCRHRAILFKFLCDHMCAEPEQWGQSISTAGAVPDGVIECSLVRGVQYQRDEKSGGVRALGHMWNVVLVDGHEYVVDVMQCAERLIPLNSNEALAYSRIASDATVRARRATSVLIGVSYFVFSLCPGCGRVTSGGCLHRSVRCRCERRHLSRGRWLR